MVKWVITGKWLSRSLVLQRSMGRLPCSRLEDSSDHPDVLLPGLPCAKQLQDCWLGRIQLKGFLRINFLDPEGTWSILASLIPCYNQLIKDLTRSQEHSSCGIEISMITLVKVIKFSLSIASESIFHYRWSQLRTRRVISSFWEWETDNVLVTILLPGKQKRKNKITPTVDSSS